MTLSVVRIPALKKPESSQLTEGFFSTTVYMLVVCVHVYVCM